MSYATDTIPGRCTAQMRYASPLALMHDLRRMGASNALSERRRTPLRRTTLHRVFEIYAERFADPDGRIRATFEIGSSAGRRARRVSVRPERRSGGSSPSSSSAG